MKQQLAVLAGILGLIAVSSAEVVIVKDGQATSAIYADAAVMDETKRQTANHTEVRAEKERVRLRESVKDLAGILERISGAEVPVITNAVPNGKVVPIYIGSQAEKLFGKPRKHSKHNQGLRVVVSKKGVGLFGESDEASSYAIYELLDQMGCRWYMPGELGEVLPSLKTIALEEMDVSSLPGTIMRDTWCWQGEWVRRNRQGGIEGASSGHCLEAAYLCHPSNIHLLKEHPDWNMEGKDGKRTVCGRVCWASDGAAKATGDIIIKQLDEKYKPFMGLAPADSVWFCQCDDCKALDTGDYDPAFGTDSMTDRYINFINKIVKQVHTKYPEMVFCALAYEQYTRPPLREKPDPSIHWHFAPILYCRSHSFMNTNCWSRAPMKEIVAGWGKVTDKLLFRDYGYHLAEVSAPFPMITKWSEELPFVYKSGWTMWRPETMPTYEACMPGLYLGIRMSWYTDADPKAILDEMFTKFYGNAAAPMRDYWMTFDRAWTECPEHAGGIYSYLERFTPAVMGNAREAMNAAIKAARTDIEKKRVDMVNDSLTMFESFMNMYRGLYEGRLAGLGPEKDQWLEKWSDLGGRKWKGCVAFSGFMRRYMPAFMGHTYDDATRVAKEFKIMTPKPILKWRYKIDKDDVGKKGWFKANLDDNEWPTRDITVDTWADLGLWTYYGRVWNRTNVKLPKVRRGKKVYLWISRTDGGATVYVNGKHIKFVAPAKSYLKMKEGEVVDEYVGQCWPASFDITSAVKRGKKNQITIVGRRARLYELGTGGLTGPVYIYCER